MSPEIPEACRRRQGLRVTRFEPGQVLEAEVVTPVVMQLLAAVPPIVLVVCLLAGYELLHDAAGDLLARGHTVVFAAVLLGSVPVLALLFYVPAARFFRGLSNKRILLRPDALVVATSTGKLTFPLGEIAEIRSGCSYTESENSFSTLTIKVRFKDPARKELTLAEWDDDLQSRATAQSEFLAGALKTFANQG